MSVWSKYPKEQRDEYINFLRMYASLSKMFNQKSSETGSPYLDSKFQEMIYSRSFNSPEVDIGNTPHDIVSEFNDSKIGIGIKTWLSSKPSAQKVMQLKAYKNEIEKYKGNLEALAYKLAQIKNERMLSDYSRLGLSEDKNIYHYVTRDKGKLVLQETSYPLVDINTLQPVKCSKSSFTFKDKYKTYKYTFSDCQIWMWFGHKNDHTILDEENIDIMSDPFNFLKEAFNSLKNNNGIFTFNHNESKVKDITYLPLYSFSSNKVGQKSGLNAFNAAPKSKNGTRPDAEAYIPIPRQYWKYHPNWFNKNIDFRDHKKYKEDHHGDSSYRFTLHLPDGTRHPAMICQSNFKSLQTDPQSVLGKWLLYDVFRIKRHKQEIITLDKLQKAGYDSVKLWHKNPNNPKDVWIDFAPIGSFEQYMKDSKNKIH